MPIRYEKPEVRDAAAMWALARDAGALDLNSPYYYLTLSNQFSDSSIVAKSDNEVVGFVAGIRPPRAPDTLFVWQITVADAYRRRGVAQGMLRALMTRLGLEGVRYLEATVTPSNLASQRMFRRFAEGNGAACEESPLYGSQLFPSGEHEEERLLRMGPFDAPLVEPELAEAGMGEP